MYINNTHGCNIDIYVLKRRAGKCPCALFLVLQIGPPFFYFNNISFVILSRLFFRLSEKAREVAVVVVIRRGVA